MRIVGLILGVLGGLAAGALGIKWLSDAHQMRELIGAARELGVDTGELDKLVMAAYVLIAAMVMGIAGGVLAFKGRGRYAAGLMLVGALLPVVFAPKALAFTFLLLVGGCLSFMAKPRQKAEGVLLTS
ncbi:MAG TPA: hypothetical protein VKA60_14420 [Blastocatellia bacterium]|nr:hypothetical protein [Blastocatellia bacterium]